METNQHSVVTDNAGSGEFPNGEAQNSGPEALDKIRSILFGEEARRTQERFEELVSLMDKHVSDINVRLDARLQSLEDMVVKANASADEAVAREAERRGQSVDRIQTMIADLDSRLANKFGSTDAAIAELSESTERHLASTAEHLAADMEHRFNTLHTFIETAVSQLSADKADRSLMADWFAELSDRLRSE